MKTKMSTNQKYQGKVRKAWEKLKVETLGCNAEKKKWYIVNDSTTNFDFAWYGPDEIDGKEVVAYLQFRKARNNQKAKLDIFVNQYKKSTANVKVCDQVKIPGGFGYKKINCRNVEQSSRKKKGARYFASVSIDSYEQRGCCLKVSFDFFALKTELQDRVARDNKLNFDDIRLTIYNLSKEDLPLYLYYLDQTEPDKSCKFKF